MWTGVFPAVTTKFTETDALDLAEMERCFQLQMDAGCDGLIVCGSLGEAMALDPEEKLEILKVAKSVSNGAPVLMTVCESSTRRATKAACDAAQVGADGLMVLPGVPYRSAPHETVAHFKEVTRAANLPVMIYNNPVAYGVDVTLDMFAELADEPLIVAVKESTDDIRRATEVFNRFGDRFDVLTGVDNLALESLLMGAHGWVAGLVVAFPRETVAIYQLVQQGRIAEAREIYRWFRPLLDLDVSTNLVQNIKLAEMVAIGSNDKVRAPRLPLSGVERARVIKVVEDAIACRPELPELKELCTASV